MAMVMTRLTDREVEIIDNAIITADVFGLGRISNAKEQLEDYGYEWDDDCEDYVLGWDEN